MFDPVLNERREEFATDEEHVAYWLGFCQDAVGRAAAKAEAKRQAMRGPTMKCEECGDHKGSFISVNGIWTCLRHLPKLGQDRRSGGRVLAPVVH